MRFFIRWKQQDDRYRYGNVLWFDLVSRMELQNFLSTDSENPCELIYNNGSSETSNTRLHGAVTPKQTISWPTTAVQSPESHYKHYYITSCLVLYLPVLSHSIYYGQTAGSPLVRRRLPFGPDIFLFLISLSEFCYILYRSALKLQPKNCTAAINHNN